MSQTPPYEIFAVPTHEFHLMPSEFVQSLPGGLFVVLTERSEAASNPTFDGESGGAKQWNRDFVAETGAWLHIGTSGEICVFTGKVEVGQDIRTSLAQIIAEELRVTPNALSLVMADTDLTPFDMGTFGSRTTPFTGPHFRYVAAAARELLLDLASQNTGAERAELSVFGGQICYAATNRTLGFGELTRELKTARRLRSDVPVMSPQASRIVGQSVPKVNARAMATGTHRYTSDLQMPGMMWGKILRPATFKATLESLDNAEARAMPGVIVVREGDFVGVAAPHPDLAERALASLKSGWSQPVHPLGSEVFDYFHDENSSDAVQGARNSEPWVQGDLPCGLQMADCVVEANYRIAFIAHAPLETRAALAHWTGDGPNQRLTVWTGTQRPFGVRDELAQEFEMPVAQIRVIVPDTGSGYGGKHSGEVAIEAARLARGAKSPVKLVWTREEEFTWAYFRPGGVIRAKAGARRDGTLTAWEFHNTNSGSAGICTLYDALHQHIEFHAVESPLRQGSYRALASTANHFARECLMDEIAHQIGMDKLEFRLKNLPGERMRAVLLAATQHFGWNTVRAPGCGFGIAVGTEKGGYVANCVEVSVKDGNVRVERITTAFECGAIINPDNLRNQIEGAVVQGMGGALFEAMQWEQGRIINPCFSGYRVPRFSDMPVLETILLDRRDLPSAGAGEAPIIAVAAAIGNAIFEATGVRYREMPLIPPK